MRCPNGCDFTMYEIDDCGDGTQGHECGMCGVVVSVEDEPCPKGVDGEPCLSVDGPHGGMECLMCGRDM